MIEFKDFLKCHIHIGKILKAELNPRAHKTAYVLQIDFGPEGIKTSSAQITQNYSAEELIGKQVCAVLNFPPKRVAGVVSECLVLAAVCDENKTVLLSPTKEVKEGTRVF